MKTEEKVSLRWTVSGVGSKTFRMMSLAQRSQFKKLQAVAALQQDACNTKT